MRDKGIDYFENTRRATYVQQRYAIDNPLEFAGYGKHCWGITASDGPGPDTIKVNRLTRKNPAIPTGGYRRGITGSTRARSIQ